GRGPDGGRDSRKDRREPHAPGEPHVMIMTTLRLMAGRIGNLLGSLVAFTLAIIFMLATVTILVSTLDGPGTTVRFGEADLVVRVDAGAALDVPADALPESLNIRVPANAQ